MSLKKFIVVILAIILISGLIAGWFYWFQWRTIQIRKKCFSEATKAIKEDVLNKAKESNLSDEAKENLKRNLENIDVNRLISVKSQDFNKYYQVCLLEHGIKSEAILLNKTDNQEKQEASAQQTPNRNTTDTETTYVENVETENESWINENKIKQQKECQEKINKYNICMNEYNSEMADYNTCLSETNNPDSIKYGWYCHKPINTCFKPLSCD